VNICRSSTPGTSIHRKSAAANGLFRPVPSAACWFGAVA
jgi:hypothetical protein